jgi:DNA-directed RNA polymerase subunit RPC12/RpoP
MSVRRTTCDNCGSPAIVLKFKDVAPTHACDPPAHLLLQIRCPNCGERQQVKPADGVADPAIQKRAYLSH